MVFKGSFLPTPTHPHPKKLFFLQKKEKKRSRRKKCDGSFLEYTDGFWLQIMQRVVDQTT